MVVVMVVTVVVTVVAVVAAADGEKHHESERIGGIVSRRARPLQWNALTGSDGRSRSYGTDGS